MIWRAIAISVVGLAFYYGGYWALGGLALFALVEHVRHRIKYGKWMDPVDP